MRVSMKLNSLLLLLSCATILAILGSPGNHQEGKTSPNGNSSHIKRNLERKDGFNNNPLPFDELAHIYEKVDDLVGNKKMEEATSKMIKLNLKVTLEKMCKTNEHNTENLIKFVKHLLYNNEEKGKLTNTFLENFEEIKAKAKDLLEKFHRYEEIDLTSEIEENEKKINSELVISKLILG
uniref:DUF148 domain-containing protein n=1 Tax=Meloidogyne hapla TaxID=6305 RepID=A0A1I8BT08_MELHA